MSRISQGGFSKRLNFPVHRANKGIALQSVASEVVLYASMEPCSVRTSWLPSCSAAILSSGIKHVRIGVEEPADYVECQGVRELTAAGVSVVRVQGLEQECLEAARRSLGKQ